MSATKIGSAADKRRELAELIVRARDLSRELNPLTRDAAEAAPTWRAAYSDRTCALMATFCAIAYDRFEETTGAQIAAMSEKLAGGGFRLVRTYDVNACTQAFLAVGAEFAVLAFRGTESSADWRVNLNARRLPLADRPAVTVHGGFLAAFQSVEDQIRADLAQTVPLNLGLYITGHSLGGALAQIASAAFARDNLAACYTFGSPRVGGVAFDSEVKCPHYRLVNNWDIVPGLPPPLWRGYLHGGDVRTLTRLGEPPLRRNRWAWGIIYQTIRALFRYAFRRKFFLVDDHMIWAYQEKLQVLAGDRGSKR